ncbi:diguanylate cyclase [Herpetosiphon geysericola]|uniref:diguanylate cyclase n=1 Tax=Herpetosiphon geysericola TaxID=70996 RepID=UPI0006C91019|nr:diguanylate cyclase [Herpetosiphon geysericola]
MVLSQQIQQEVKQSTNPARTIDLLNVWAANLRHIDLSQAWKINYQAEYQATNGLFAYTPYYQGLVEAWYWRGKFYSVHKKYAEALNCFYKALEYCDYVNPNIFELKNPAASYYQDAPDQFIDNWVDKMALHNILGVTLALQSQLDAALEHYLIAEEIAISTNNEWMQTILNSNIGYLYRVLEQPMEAESYLQRAFQLLPAELETKAQKRLYATMLDNSCWVALEYGQLYDALMYANASLELYQALGWSQGIVEVMNILGVVYQRFGRSAQAMAEFEASFSLAQQLGFQEDMIFSLIQRGILVASQHDYAQALGFGQRGLALAIETNDLCQQARAHSTLAAIYEQVADYANAIQHFKAYHHLRESLFNERSDQRLRLLQVTHQVLQAQQQARLYYQKTQELVAEMQERDRQRIELERLATIDSLTGLYNRRHFLVSAQVLLEQAALAGNSLAIMLFDIDHFKQINDQHGHHVGDLVLQSIATTAQAALRQSDLLGRYGGEEFIVLLSRVTKAEALLVAERLRSAIEQQRLTYEQQLIRSSVSLGLALCHEHAEISLEQLIQQADQALYQAKAAGRNTIQTFGA